MAILEGLLLDNLLENIVRSEVYIALRSDLAASTTRFGVGTSEDPFDGSKSGSIYKFDEILRNLPPNTTVYLSPGEFPTKGFRDSSSSGWAVKNGLRIIGGGWAGTVSSLTKGATILKLEGHLTGENYVVGMKTSTDTVSGVEIAHLSINCNLPGTYGIAAGAVKITGSHNRLREVRVTGFGASNSVSISCVAVSLASPSLDDALDVVAENCVFEEPSPYSTNAIVTCIELTSLVGANFFHRFSVVRGCFIDCQITGGSALFRGISVNGGVGSIVELNQVGNCDTGIFLFEGAAIDLPLTKDLIIRDNTFYNVNKGLWLNVTTNPATSTTYPVRRLIFTGNIVELATSGTPVGVNVTSTASPKTNANIEQLIIRQCHFRHVNGATGPSGTVGVKMECTYSAIIEQNLIDIGTNPVAPDVTKGILRSGSVTKIKTFDNHSTSGVFLGCWNGSTHDPDLVTDVEDGLIGAFKTEDEDNY